MSIKRHPTVMDLSTHYTTTLETFKKKSGAIIEQDMEFKDTVIFQNTFYFLSTGRGT